MVINLEPYLKLIDLVHVDHGEFIVYAGNEVFMGKIVKDVDGFYCFYPESGRSGVFPESYMLAVGAHLFSLNEAWREELSKIY